MTWNSNASSIALFASAAILWIEWIRYQKKMRKSQQPFPIERRQKRIRKPLDAFPPLQNDLLLRAIRGQPTERVPVWCMRQAGRHLPEFRALREAGYDFFTMCEVPELAVEVSLQPLRRYGTDAVIIFSDILVVPQAMGMEVLMVPGKGPFFPSPIRTPEDMKKLEINPDIEASLGYVMDAINLAREKINGQVPLIGFCGGPLTLMTYMIEGGSSRNKALVKEWLYKLPSESHELLQSITDVCVEFLVAQYRAGAQALQVFESVAAETLTQEQFYTFAAPYMAQIASRVKEIFPDAPMIGFSKGTPYAYSHLSESRFDCLGLDWQSNPAEVRNQVKGKVTLQGNLDPCVLYAPPQIIQEETRKMLKSFGTQGYIANLGHGCLPDMDPEHVQTFISSIQQVSEELNNK